MIRGKVDACRVSLENVRPIKIDSSRKSGFMFGRWLEKVTISNDGATIMKLLDIAHPAAKTLVDISMSQDAEVRKETTGTKNISDRIITSVTYLLGGSFSRCAYK